ncbi:MAG: response regulator [Bacteroidota bacterium]
MNILIQDENDLLKKSFLQLELAELHINKYRDKSDSIAQLALQYAQQSQDVKLLSEALSLLGYINYKDEKDHTALIYYHSLDSLLATNNIKNDLLLKSKMYQSQIAKFSFTEEGLERSKEHLEEMVAIAKEINSGHYESLAYLNLGAYYGLRFEVDGQEENLTIQDEYYLKALDYFESVNDTVNIAKTYWSLGSSQRYVNDFKKGEQYLLKRLAILKGTKNLLDLGNAYHTLGGYNYQYIKNYPRAITFYDSAMSIFQEQGFENAQYRLGILNGYALTYREMERFEQAFDYLDKAYMLKDSLDRNRSRQATIEFETKYQAQKKQQEIELLTAQNELAAQSAKTRQYFLIGVVVVIALAALFFFFLYRNRQKTATKLQELDTIKSNFFANISHEFRTPLTLIKSPIETQLSKKLQQDERENLETIDRNADRLLVLVDQLLDLSKLESGSMSLRVQSNSLSSFIKAVSSSFKYLASQKKIDFSMQIAERYEADWFDEDIIEKVVVNLLTNAIKYTPEEGKVTLALAYDQHHATITVRNSGSDISPDDVRKVFERFYQADSTNQGVGIGLALAKELITLHHGTIEFLPTDEGMTTFIVRFPRAKDAFKEEEIGHGNKTSISNEASPIALKHVSKSDAENGVNDGPIMLVVEDNQDVRTLIAKLFKDDYTILEAKDGVEGLEKAIEYIPDIIISDVMMPNRDGNELCQMLKSDERTSHIPIVLLTAKAGEGNVIKGLETGADDYLVKPFNNEVLTVRVQKLIELRHKLRQRYSQEVVLRPKDIAISSADEKLLERMQVVLDEQLADPTFNADQFSKAIGMSRMQLHRKLKALVGLTTTEFIRSQRLKLAAHLLESTKVNMAEVGYSVGFNDPSYFAKCFREIYHCTPKEYAATHKA